MAEQTRDSSKSNQHKRFVEAARELGCDESEERFDQALKKVAKTPAPAQEAKPQRKRKKA